MNEGLLVELPNGTFVSKAPAALRPDDSMVFDRPESFDFLAAAQIKLDAEIAAAGGFDAWQDDRASALTAQCGDRIE